MSLPARALQPATRAIGMGIFYTVYYAAMMLGPVIGGAYAKWSGSAGRGIRVRRRRGTGLSGPAVGLQPDCARCAEDGLIAYSPCSTR
jgi:MFS family permease